jgi:hypothetical protein
MAQGGTMNEKKFEGKFISKDNYLHLDIYKIYEAEDAHEMWQFIQKETEGKQNRKMLVNLTTAVQTSISMEARRAFKDYQGFFLTVSKLAFIVTNPIIRMLAKTAMTTIDKNKVCKYFKTVEEGLAWLKEEN